MPDAYVGIGSNIDALKRLRQALAPLGERFSGLRASSVYRSPPVGFNGPDFLNMAVAFRCGLEPEALLDTLHEIERLGGRRKERDGSRTLDLDLLLLGRRVDAAQRLPRHDLLRYAFVLAPLAELSGQLVHPVTGARMVDAWAEMRAAGPPLERLGPIDSL